MSHIGPQSCVELLAGEAVQGALRWKGVVWNFEHRAAAAKRARSKEFHASNDEDVQAALDARVAVPNGGEGDSDRSPLAYEVFLYQGDVTTSEAIDRQKLHVSRISSIACTLDDVEVDEAGNLIS